MASRAKDKHSPTSSPLSSSLSATKERPLSSNSLLPSAKLVVYLSLFFSLWLLLLFLCFPPSPSPSPSPVDTDADLLPSSDEFLADQPPRSADDQCDPDIAPFYVYPLPSRFNSDFLRACKTLNMFTDMCPYVEHRGLGRPLLHLPGPGAADPASWFATNQFVAEMLFHARLDRHPCRTQDPDSAHLFYVPFYAGLYTSSHFDEGNHTLRDALALDLASYLSSGPHWGRRHGHDHFLVAGRTAWDMMRSSAPGAADFGANRLFLLPEVENMTVLTVERHSWEGQNQFGVPYPTCFHPSTSGEVATWQESVRRSSRTHLFTFLGGARDPKTDKGAMRAHVLRQCGESKRCLRVECEPGSPQCYEPDRVLGVMLRAQFCLHPPGDSFTRRAVFDSVLAGCIPVFFSEHTAYTQYQWYVADRAEDWSVYLGPERAGRIEDVLGLIPKPEIERMRERVVEMIPRVTYAHPYASWAALGFRDAVDTALIGLTKHVRSTLHEA